MLRENFRAPHGGSERSVSGSRVDMLAGLLALVTDSLVVAVATARSSDLISGVRCSWEDVE